MNQAPGLRFNTTFFKQLLKHDCPAPFLLFVTSFNTTFFKQLLKLYKDTARGIADLFQYYILQTTTETSFSLTNGTATAGFQYYILQTTTETNHAEHDRKNVWRFQYYILQTTTETPREQCLRRLQQFQYYILQTTTETQSPISRDNGGRSFNTTFFKQLLKLNTRGQCGPERRVSILHSSNNY